MITAVHGLPSVLEPSHDKDCIGNDAAPICVAPIFIVKAIIRVLRIDTQVAHRMRRCMSEWAGGSSFLGGGGGHTRLLGLLGVLCQGVGRQRIIVMSML